MIKDEQSEPALLSLARLTIVSLTVVTWCGLFLAALIGVYTMPILVMGGFFLLVVVAQYIRRRVHARRVRQESR